MMTPVALMTGGEAGVGESLASASATSAASSSGERGVGAGPRAAGRRSVGDDRPRSGGHAASASASSGAAARTAARTRSTLGGRGGSARGIDVHRVLRGGSAWESNPPRHAGRRATGFEDRGAHRDPSAPAGDGSATGQPDGRRPLSSGDATLDAAPPIRLTELTECGGCAAKLGADLLAERSAGLGADARRPGRGLIAGLTRPTTRRSTSSATTSRSSGRSTSSRRSSTTRGRSARSPPRTRCSDVFAMGGRVLFALSVAAIPEDLPRDVLAGDLRRRLGEGPRGRRDAGRRPHDPRPGAEVRPRGHRRRASRSAPAQGRRASRATC